MHASLPPEPWELDYPHREDLFDVRLACTALHADPPPRGAERDARIARAQISVAYQLEKIARGYMGGKQFTGVQLQKRGVLVSDAFTAASTAAAFDAGPRTPEVQAWVDRAVGCLRQCFDHDLVVLEWDRPGYDDVTRSFQRLLSYASNPDVTPVVLPWEPAYLGEPEPDMAPEAIARARHARRVDKALGKLAHLPLVAAAAMLLFAGYVALRPKGGYAARSTKADPVPCGVQLQRIREGLQGGGVLASIGDDPEARREALAKLEAGDFAAAEARLKTSSAVGVQFVSTQVFLYRYECAK
jgi:hypothetical protein